MYSTCTSDSNTGYCSNKKLIIEQKKLNDIIKILANKITDPTTWKWLFNNSFVEKTVNFFRFIQRKNETITIEFIN